MDCVTLLPPSIPLCCPWQATVVRDVNVGEEMGMAAGSIALGMDRQLMDSSDEEEGPEGGGKTSSIKEGLNPLVRILA